ncbi:MAG: class A sortase [Liquorilactobacillus ghanensis]|uniref:class A sortase n=1 Tax=Liquorilactobacillus ghanensis TaxID=399370 RepID=UPI0039ECBEBA
MKRNLGLKVLVIILLIVGLGLVFNQQIANFLVKQMSSSALTEKTTKTVPKKGNFNFKKVKQADSTAIAKESLNSRATGMIGKISLPAVGLKLPIFYGISNANLLRGAGTMKPNQKMGQGNYALAGHHMNNPNILFSPLAKAKIGELAYLTDGKKVYTYRITVRKTISKYQVQVIDDVPQQKLLTLVTCDPVPGVARTPLRILLQGKLQRVTSINKQTSKMFE